MVCYRRLDVGQIIRMYQITVDDIPGNEFFSGITQLANVFAGVLEGPARLIAPNDSNGGGHFDNIRQRLKPLSRFFMQPEIDQHLRKHLQQAQLLAAVAPAMAYGVEAAETDTLRPRATWVPSPC